MMFDVFMRHLYAFVCIPNYYVMVRCNDIHLAKACQYALLSLVGPSSSFRIGSHLGRDIDPGFEEDPNIFVVLAEGVFYQTSYDGTEVAIIADYPGLLPASQVSKQETPPLKGCSYSAPPTALSRVL